jgi:hypothetical protein
MAPGGILQSPLATQQQLDPIISSYVSAGAASAAAARGMGGMGGGMGAAPPMARVPGKGGVAAEMIMEKERAINELREMNQVGRAEGWMGGVGLSHQAIDCVRGCPAILLAHTAATLSLFPTAARSWRARCRSWSSWSS